jgi:hypothetical protein
MITQLLQLRKTLLQLLQNHPEQGVEISEAIDIVDKLLNAGSPPPPSEDIKIRGWYKDLFSRILGSVIGHVLENTYDDFTSNDDL